MRHSPGGVALLFLLVKQKVCTLMPGEPTSVCLKVTGLTLVTQPLVAMAQLNSHSEMRDIDMKCVSHQIAAFFQTVL